jgi:hypothetical protein
MTPDTATSGLKPALWLLSGHIFGVADELGAEKHRLGLPGAG